MSTESQTTEFTAADFEKPLAEISRRLKAGEQMTLQDCADILGLPIGVLIASVIEWELQRHPDCEILIGFPAARPPGQQTHH